MLENMHAIEKQVFRTYWDDGLLDVFAAAGVLAIGLSWVLDFHVGGAIAPALLIPLWTPFRRRLIEPRLGFVEFSEQRERRNRARLRTVAFIGAGTFVLAIVLYLARVRLGLNPPVSLIAGLPAGLLALLAVITAFFVSTPRFLIHAGLLLVSGVAGALYGLEPGIILVISAILMLAVAVAVLTRFLRDNPVGGDAA